MTMHQRLAVAVKCGGKVLREHGDTVFLPFGSEYSLLIKNLDTQKRVVADIKIDGREVVEGGLVINANSSIDLKRFVEDGNFDVGPAFKFQQMTSAIEQSRGCKLEDGILQVSFRFEEPIVYGGFIWRDDTWVKPYWQQPTYFCNSTLRSMNVGSAVGQTHDTLSADAKGMADGNINCCYSAQVGATVGSSSFGDALAAAGLDQGITVKGEEVKQGFKSVSIDESRLGAVQTIVLKLKGDVGQTKVSKPLTVKTKPVCSECGTKNPSTARFCMTCGNNLKY